MGAGAPARVLAGSRNRVARNVERTQLVRVLGVRARGAC